MEYYQRDQNEVVMQTFFGSRDIFCETCKKALTRPSRVKTKNPDEYFPNYYCKRCVKRLSEFKQASSLMHVYEVDGFRFIVFSI